MNLIGYLFLFIGILGALAYTEVERRDREKDVARAIVVNCEFGNRNTSVLATILKDANRRTQTSKQRSPEEKKDAQKFYDKALSRLQPEDCESLIAKAKTSP